MEVSSFTRSVPQPQNVAVNHIQSDQILPTVEDVLSSTAFIDMHTHLFSPALGRLGLWGIDELITYHYLEAEFFRYSDMSPEQYGTLTKSQQADNIWRTLFLHNTPISEAARGVIAVLQAFGLPTQDSDLRIARDFFAEQTIDAHIQRVFDMAGMKVAVMTNDPLDPEEAPAWMKGIAEDVRFQPVLRLDRILTGWSDHWSKLESQGYKVEANAGGRSIAEIRRFLADWHQRMR